LQHTKQCGGTINTEQQDLFRFVLLFFICYEGQGNQLNLPINFVIEINIALALDTLQHEHGNYVFN